MTDWKAVLDAEMRQAARKAEAGQEREYRKQGGLRSDERRRA